MAKTMPYTGSKFTINTVVNDDNFFKALNANDCPQTVQHKLKTPNQTKSILVGMKFV